jgi:TonB-linked SusC/RagA family outer membrane protein
MKKTLLFIALLLTLGVQNIQAQTRTVKGRVLDKQGEGVPAATVKVKGTQAGTMTDMDGNYEITLPDGQEVLEISALSMGTKELKVGADGIVANVVLEEDATSLGTIEVMGTKVDPKTYVGSVATVTAADIAKRPVTNVLSALAGSAPGIQVSSGGGQPGSSPDIVMRGFGSLSASNSPIIVLDGAVYQGNMSSINPADVETISLLKDATATSLYGARGGNGVVLITTKRGKKSDKPTINIDAQTGFNTRAIPMYETMDSKSWMEAAYDGYLGIASAPSESQFVSAVLGGYNPYKVPSGEKLFTTDEKGLPMLNPNASLLYSDNWLKELTRTGIRHQYNISISNGDAKSDYFLSAGYNNDQGVVKESGFERITTRLNVNSKITPWLKTGVNLSGNFTNQRFFVTTQNAYQNPFFTSQSMGPIYPVYLYDDNGNRQYDANGEPLYDFGVSNGKARIFAYNMNPVASLYQDDRSTKAVEAVGITYLEATIAKDITARANFSFNYYNSRTNQLQNMLFGDAENVNGRFNRTLQNQWTYTFNQTVTWKPSFGPFNPEDGHSLSISAVHENYALQYDNSNITRTGFTDPVFQQADAAAVNESSGGYQDNHRLETYLGSLAYNYKSKYFFSAAFNHNGTSRFSPKVRWGNFWSVGAGWMLSQESFIKDNLTWINELKLRASYGISGQEDLGGSYYPWLPRYTFNPNGNYNGYTFSSWGNENLKWEGQAMFSVGIDYSLFNGRITGNLDYYRRESKDLLYVRPLAPSTGISGIQENIGKTRNAGVEFLIKADVVRAQGANAFNWNVSFNATHYKNKMVELQGSDTVIYGGGTIFGVGYSVAEFFMPHYIGVDPQTGNPIYAATKDRDAQGNLIDNPSGETQDYQIANLVENRVRVGSAIRDLEGGMTNTFSYKGFDLSFLLQFGLGGKFYDNVFAGLMTSDNAYQGQAWAKDMERRWRQPGDITDVPRADFGSSKININVLSDRFLVSNSYLQIKSAQLGYNLPAKVFGRSGFRSARIFIQSENIWLFAAKKGMDIQQSFFGIGSFNYSPNRTVMFGVNLGL